MVWASQQTKMVGFNAFPHHCGPHGHPVLAPPDCAQGGQGEPGVAGGREGREEGEGDPGAGAVEEEGEEGGGGEGGQGGGGQKGPGIGKSSVVAADIVAAAVE